MKAVVIRTHGGPEVLKLEQVPRPQPEPGQVLVKVRACALNHLDIWRRRGIPGVDFKLPAITGADVAGDVHAVGAGVEGPPVGTPVMVIPGISCGHCAMCVSGDDHLCARYEVLGEGTDGGMAEYLVVPAENVVGKPARFTYEEAAAASLTFLTAWRMLVGRAELRGGETVLVQAAGSGVSTAGIQIARYLGARVVATASHPRKLEAARALGADEVVDYTREDFVERVRALTDRRGVDVVLEHVGGETFERSMRCLARGGRLVTCGATTGPSARVNLSHVFFKSQSILGSTMGSKGDFHRLVALFERGLFEPVIDRVLPLERAAEAHAALERREVFGKVVLVP